MGTWKQSRSRKPLSLKDCKLKMTDSIKQIEKIILTSEDDNKQIAAANALSGLVNRYSKLLSITTLEERISKLEEQNNIS